jgi:hypothetical protein
MAALHLDRGAHVSWQDEENARRAARLARQREWDERYQERDPLPCLHGLYSLEDDPAAGARWDEDELNSPWQTGMPEYPDPPPRRQRLGDEPPEPGLVLLGMMNAASADPADKAIEAAAEAADRQAVAELDAGITRMTDARAELRAMPRRNPDGTRLSGSAGKEWITRNESRIRHHWEDW